MPRNTFASNAIAVSTWAMPLGRPERIDLVAAVEHRVGKARAAEEHADHRPVLAVAVAQRDQLARDGVAAQVSVRASSISRSSVSIGSPRAPRSSAMRLVLPLGSTATGGGSSPKWPPL